LSGTVDAYAADEDVSGAVSDSGGSDSSAAGGPEAGQTIVTEPQAGEPQAAASQSDESQGAGSQSDESQGAGSQSDESQGAGSQAEESQGAGSQSDESQGAGSQAEEPQAAGSQMEEPQAEEPQTGAPGDTEGTESSYDGAAAGLAGGAGSLSAMAADPETATASISVKNENNDTAGANGYVMAKSGEKVTYTLTLSNPADNTNPIGSISIMDALPEKNDTTASTNQGRGSQFELTDISNIGVLLEPAAGGTEQVDPGSYRIYLSKAGMGAINSWGPPGGGWQEGDTLSGSNAFFIVFDAGFELAPGEELMISFDAQMPAGLTANTTAWNSAAFRYTDDGVTSTIESPLTGVMVGDPVVPVVPKTIDVTGKNTWIDNNNASGARPSSVTLTLKANGTVVKGAIPTWNKSGGSVWTYAYAGLPKADNVADIVYTVEMAAVTGYAQSHNGNDFTNTINRYTVKYEGNGNTGGKAPTDSHSPYNYKSKATVLGNTDKLTREHYSFLGWATGKTAETPTYTVNGSSISPVSFTVTGDVTLYAVWREDDKYTVTYQPGEHGTFAPKITKDLYYGDATPAAPDAPGKEGYNFTGWSPAPSATVTGDATYIAQWEPILLSVQFVDIDRTLLDEQMIEYGGSAVAPSAPEKNGFAFTGWDRGYTNVTSDITVMAQYSPAMLLSDGEFVPLSSGGAETNTLTPQETLTQIMASGIPMMTLGQVSIPLAPSQGMNQNVWAFVNLILAVSGAMFVAITGITALWGKRRGKGYDETAYFAEDTGSESGFRRIWLIAMIIFGILGVVVFLLTQNIDRLMVMVDNYTFLNALIFALCIVTTKFVSGKSRKSS